VRRASRARGSPPGPTLTALYRESATAAERTPAIWIEQGCVHAAERDVCSRGVAGIRRLALDQPLDELLKPRLG
jgi:hypothetical protein